MHLWDWPGRFGKQYLLKIRVSSGQARTIPETIANDEPEIAQELAV